MQNIELRDHFAGQALAGMADWRMLIDCETESECALEIINAAALAYRLADAMMTARQRTTAPLSPAESQAQFVAEVAAEKQRTDAELLMSASMWREYWEQRCQIYEDMCVSLMQTAIQQRDVLRDVLTRLIAAGEKASALEAEIAERQGVPVDVAAVYQTTGDKS